MRNVFFILVLGNVLFAAWQWWRPAQPAAARARDTDVPGIVLAREARDEGVARLGRDPPAPAPATRCVSVGPFSDEALATRAADALRAAGHAPTPRPGEADVRIGYWVYVADVGAEAAAGTVAERFREGGITDAYVVSDDDIGVVVSLGVFNDRERADRLRARSVAIGFEPTVAERTRRATVHWLDIAAAGNSASDPAALQETLRTAEIEPPSGAELRVEPCPAAAAP